MIIKRQTEVADTTKRYEDDIGNINKIHSDQLQNLENKLGEEYDRIFFFTTNLFKKKKIGRNYYKFCLMLCSPRLRREVCIIK